MAMSSEPFCKHNICFPFVLFSSGNINKHPQVYITIQYILYADYLDVVMLYITKLTIPGNLKELLHTFHTNKLFSAMAPRAPGSVCGFISTQST